MSAAVSVDVQNASAAVSVPDATDIQAWVELAISQLSQAPGEVSVRIVDEEEGRQLNNTWRGEDVATNVLSFPADNGLPADAPRSFGDIVICGPVVEREASEQGKATADHWAHMLVHGALHLLGYDHEIDNEALEMEALERQILAACGVDDPYAA
jgi:probable rRNA maturation factor